VLRALTGNLQVRRRKDPTPFNVLVIGARSSGKTSFINFLKHSLALPARKQTPARTSDSEPQPPSTRSNRDFTHSYQEIEVDHERLGLTLWDSQGLDKSVVDLQLRELTNFVESKFDDTFLEEVKVVRSHGALDTHIHCVFFILDPARLNQNLKAAQQGPTNGTASRVGKVSRIIGALDEDFDLQVIRALQGKTVVVPVISKADTVTTQHMAFLKKKVWESLKRAGLDPLEAVSMDDDDSSLLEEVDEDDEKLEKSSDDDSTPASPGSAHTEDSDTVPSKAAPNSPPVLHKREPSNISISNSMMDSGYVPLSILSPDEYSLESGDGPVGRQFPWGFADPYNSDHCDFVKLKDAVFSEWRSELREASRERFYEAWRTNRLNLRGGNKTSTAPRKSGGIPISLDRARA
jgi:septin family protein